MPNTDTVFWYQGPATNGEKIEGLTWEQAMELQKKEDDMLAQQKADAQMGTNLNKEVAGYVNQNPAADPRQQQQATPLSSVPVSSGSPVQFGMATGGNIETGIDSLIQARQGQKTNELLNSIPATSSAQESNISQQQTANSEAMGSLLEGIPPELTKDLIWQYHQGALSPSKFVKEIANIRKELVGIKREKDKASYESGLRINEQNVEDQGVMDRLKTQISSTEGISSADRRSRENIAQWDNASNERVAALNAQNKATKEDRALVQIDKTLRNDYVVKQRTEQLQYAQNTLDLLKSDNPVANQASKTQLARLSGEVGVLTDKDTERFGGSKAVVTKIEQALKEAATGKLSEKNKSFLTDLATTFYTAAQNSLNSRLNELASGQSEAFNVPIERISPLVNAYGIGNTFQEESKNPEDKYVTGKVYSDANGNKAVYKGNGQWEEVQ
jgi:hypothetical protein